MYSQRHLSGTSAVAHNQGVAPPPMIQPPTRSGVDCPYHAAIIRLRPRQVIPQGLHPKQRLQYTPISDVPFAVVQSHSEGTAAAGGCICNSSARVDLNEFSRDIEAIIKASRCQGEDTTTKRS